MSKRYYCRKKGNDYFTEHKIVWHTFFVSPFQLTKASAILFVRFLRNKTKPWIHYSSWFSFDFSSRKSTSLIKWFAVKLWNFQSLGFVRDYWSELYERICENSAIRPRLSVIFIILSTHPSRPRIKPLRKVQYWISWISKMEGQVRQNLVNTC